AWARKGTPAQGPRRAARSAPAPSRARVRPRSRRRRARWRRRSRSRVLVEDRAQGLLVLEVDAWLAEIGADPLERRRRAGPALGQRPGQDLRGDLPHALPLAAAPAPQLLQDRRV